MTAKSWGKILFFASAALLLLFLPLLIESDYVMHLLIMSGIYIISTQSLNFIAGYMGAISIGHAAFCGIGAYTSALLALHFGLPFWVTSACGTGLAGLVGLFLAIPTLKLKSSYLVITTIAFGKIVHLLFVNTIWLTRGPLGLLGIPAPFELNIGPLRVDFGSKAHYYYFVLGAVCLVMVLFHRLVNSRTGRAVMAIREDDIAAEVIGVDVMYHKIMVFVIGTGAAGFAGTLYAHYIHFISPETFSIYESITLLIMVIVGGSGSFFGPILGAVSITFLLEQLRFLSDYRLMIYGVILFFVIFFMPRGLIGLFDLAEARLVPALSGLFSKRARP